LIVLAAGSADVAHAVLAIPQQARRAEGARVVTREQPQMAEVVPVDQVGDPSLLKSLSRMTAAVRAGAAARDLAEAEAEAEAAPKAV
jgi:hypothetical protein